MKRFLQQWPILIAGLLLISGASAATVVHRPGAPTGATTTISVLPTAGLVGYWPLDAATIASDFAADKSGHSTDAHVVGDYSIVSGKIAGGIALGGASFINLPIQRSFDGLSVSLWFKPDSVTSSNARLMANAHTDAAPHVGFQLDFNTGGASGFFDVGNGSSEGRATWSGMTLQVGQWYHYVGTYDGAHVRAYINGVQVAEEDFTGAVAAAPDDIAVGYNPAYTDDFFDGTVDDVRVYDRALTPGEVSVLYKNPSTTINASQNGRISNGLVALWSFDGADMHWSDRADGVALDASGNEHTGTLNNFSQKYSVAPGKLGQALRFNGTDEYIDTSYTIPAQNSSTSFTWSTWAKLDPGNGDNTLLLGFRNGDSWIKLTPTRFEYLTGGPNNAVTIPVGQWVHIAIVKNHSSITYYLNGIQVTSAADASFVQSGPFYMGADPAYEEDGMYKGLLDDVRVYDRALSTAEVRTLYLAGK